MRISVCTQRNLKLKTIVYKHLFLNNGSQRKKFLLYVDKEKAERDRVKKGGKEREREIVGEVKERERD